MFAEQHDGEIPHWFKEIRHNPELTLAFLMTVMTVRNEQIEKSSIGNGNKMRPSCPRIEPVRLRAKPIFAPF
jgi:hypothetical protein